MFQVNDDLSIYMTRGDILSFNVTATDDDGKPFMFQPGDVVRLKVYGKKDAETVVLQKDFPVADYTETVGIFLTGAETKFGEVISKHSDYWYEIELNPNTNPRTIVGYDEDGAKLFRLYPEGGDVPESVPDPKVIRVIDTELDMTSERPVQNQAVARAIAQINARFGNEKAEFDAIALVSNLLTEDGWQAGRGWSGDFNNGFTHTGNSEPLTYPVDSYAEGFYVLAFDVTNQYSSTTESALLVSVGGSPAFEQYRFDGDGTQYFTFYPSEGDVVFTPSANWSGTVKNVGLYQLS